MKLLEHVQEIGFMVGNPELNYMTDPYRDKYAQFEENLENLITDMENLK